MFDLVSLDNEPFVKALDWYKSDFFDRFFDFTVEKTPFSPRLDFGENKDSFILKLEVPGFEPDDIEVSLEGKYLTITGEKKKEKEEIKYHKKGIYKTKFKEQIRLPDNAGDKIDGEIKNGILTLNIAKKEKSKPISIRVHG